MKKKRKRSTITTARAAINAEADRLIKAGVLQRPERKRIGMGGRRPEPLAALRRKSTSSGQPDESTP